MRIDESNPSPIPGAVLDTGATHAALTHGQNLAVGEIIDGRYRIEKQVASGGFGCVYRVSHVTLKKKFALKALHSVAATERTILRLRREAEAAGKLDHPNIVKAHDFGFIDSCVPFIVMDFAEGPNLADYLKKKTTLPLNDAIKIFVPICLALAYAHQSGVIHRDIKPSNIILSRDAADGIEFVPKVVDFGIAKFQADESEMSLTKTGDIFGTPLYMSPEQCNAGLVDHRADIYAFGCVLYETLAGAPPFTSGSAFEIMMKHTQASPLSLREASLGTNYPREVERLVQKLLAKDPRDRYQNFNDVASDLLALQHGNTSDMKALVQRERLKDKKFAWSDLLTIALLLNFVGLLICAGVAGYNMYFAQMQSAVKTELGQVKPSEFLIAALGNDDSYYKKRTQNEYSFPEKINLGKLRFATKDRVSQEMDAVGIVRIPPDSVTLLYPGINMVQPTYWARFRHDDLRAITISGNADSYVRDEFITSQEFDYDMAVAFKQTELRSLRLHGIDCLQNTFNLIGDMQHLRWLSLGKITLRGKRGAKDISCEDIAALPNLRKLESLQMCMPNDASFTVVKALSGSHIKQIGFTAFNESNSLTSEKNFHLLANLPDIETLDHVAAATHEDFMRLAKLPKLKKLSLQPYRFQVSEDDLRQFPHLREFVVYSTGLIARKDQNSTLLNTSGESITARGADKFYLYEASWFDIHLQRNAYDILTE